MKKITLSSILLLLLCSFAFAQTIPTDSLYLGQTPPGNTPIIFQLPVSSGLMPVERITISADGKEIYYSEINNWPATNKRIKYFKYLDNKWQGPFIAFEGFMCPALSVNDSIMYMQNDLNNVACTYYSIKNTTGWSTPSRLLSTNLQTHYFQETQLKNYYLASTPSVNSDICKLKINNTDTLIQSLGKPINTTAIENDFFIARDESFMIVFRLSSPFNLFISYNKGNGKWTNPKSIGININTSIYECCPFVTNDNKYLFFTRGWSSYYTYWVKVDELIDSLQHTNFVPYLNLNIPNQTSTVGQLINYTIPDSTFIDDDGNNTLTYTAKLSNGNNLPSWLVFDSITHVFSGTSQTAEILNIKVTATDTAGAIVSTIFQISISPNSINELNSHMVNIFPNPSSGRINISLGTLSDKTAIVEIKNLEGKTIITNTFINEVSIDMFGKPNGIYIIKLYIDNEILIGKVCIVN